MLTDPNVTDDITKRGKRKGKKRPQSNLSGSIRNLLILLAVISSVLVVIEFVQLAFQFMASAKRVGANTRPVYIVDSQPVDIDVYLQEYFVNKVPKKMMYLNVTAYSSTNGQTDDDPYVTAFGTPVRDGIVAANFLPVGTVVRFPDKFGDRLFVVEDRMHERFGLQVDIWMSKQEDAKAFGIQYMEMEVF